MKRTQILLEEQHHRFLREVAAEQDRSVSPVVCEMLDEQISKQKQDVLESAAEALAPVYSTDSELTSFTALDGEEIHE